MYQEEKKCCVIHTKNGENPAGWLPLPLGVMRDRCRRLLRHDHCWHLGMMRRWRRRLQVRGGRRVMRGRAPWIRVHRLRHYTSVLLPMPFFLQGKSAEKIAKTTGRVSLTPPQLTTDNRAWYMVHAEQTQCRAVRWGGMSAVTRQQVSGGPDRGSTLYGLPPPRTVLCTAIARSVCDRITEASAREPENLTHAPVTWRRFTM